MHVDPLAPVLQHFNAQARLFFAGNLCTAFAFTDTHGAAFLHVLRAGRLRMRDATGHAEELSEPALVFYARPLSHWFEPDPERGADLACATVSFVHRSFNPIALALPDRVVRPLSELEVSAPLLELLFDEAFASRPGRQEVLNRLFEVVLIELLRGQLQSGAARAGFLRGLGDAQVGRAMLAMHARPEQAWSLDRLAREATMSRTAFAARFRELVGQTPGEYLASWRIHVAQALLRNGVALKLVAERVGYESQPGFMKAFKAIVGVSPMAWKRSGERGSATTALPA